MVMLLVLLRKAAPEVPRPSLPRGPEPARAAVGVPELSGDLDRLLHRELVALQDQLCHPVSLAHHHWLRGRMIEEHHAHIAPVVGVDDSRTHADVLFPSQAGARRDARVQSAAGPDVDVVEADCNVGLDERLAMWRDGDQGLTTVSRHRDGSIQVEARRELGALRGHRGPVRQLLDQQAIRRRGALACLGLFGWRLCGLALHGPLHGRLLGRLVDARGVSARGELHGGHG
mmetsp:Transcript_90828/g.253655  ORF Transcript_90828/g.253655 Transcript_90828/m.253655 type:complete len:230 (-) Transcript_90828:85-774(-)